MTVVHLHNNYRFHTFMKAYGNNKMISPSLQENICELQKVTNPYSQRNLMFSQINRKF